jgi:hypothetical protein
LKKSLERRARERIILLLLELHLLRGRDVDHRRLQLGTMSAKLIGAPALGAAALIAPGSFCAVCAPAG